jgi:hypothetical protein
MPAPFEINKGLLTLTSTSEVIANSPNFTAVQQSVQTREQCVCVGAACSNKLSHLNYETTGN